MVTGENSLLFMSSLDVLGTTRNYCTLVQAVTKRRRSELPFGKQCVYSSYTSHIMRQLRRFRAEAWEQAEHIENRYRIR